MHKVFKFFKIRWGMKIFIANLPWELGKREYGVRAGSRWPHTRSKRRDMYYFPFPIYLAYVAAVLEKAVTIIS